MQNVADKPCRETQNEHLTIYKYLFFFENRAVYEIMSKNFVETGRPQMTIRRMRIACWITNYKRTLIICNTHCPSTATMFVRRFLNLLKPTGHVMHQQLNIQQLYALPTLYLCVLYLSENKQRLVPLTA